MEYKVSIFVLTTLLVLPFGILFVSRHRLLLSFAFTLLVFGFTDPSSFLGFPGDINFLSHEWYRGSTRGLEISYLDLIAIIVLIGSLAHRKREGRLWRRPASIRVQVALLIWAAFNIVVSEPQIFGVFELSKMLRGILVFCAVYSFVRTPAHVRLFVMVLIAIIFYEAAIAITDRYIYGMHRIQATLPHPNSLSMFSLQILPVVLSASFANDVSRRFVLMTRITSILTAGITILSVSRTGFAALGILTLLTLYFNIRGSWTPKNVAIVVAGLFVITGMGLKAWDSVMSRFQNFNISTEYLSTQGDRGSYFHKAIPAIADNPIFGVGLNNWSYWISNRYARQAGYYSDYYPSVNIPPRTPYQEAPAHNLFLLTVTELGPIGLALLMLLFWQWGRIATQGVWQQGKGLMQRVRIGALLSLLGMLMQSFTEWEFRQTSLFFLGHTIAAVSIFLYQRSSCIGRQVR